MRKSVKSVIAGVLCGATALTTLPAELLAGPMSAAAPATVELSSPLEQVHYRRHRHYYRAYYPRYRYRHRHYRRYGYDPGGAIFAGAALGLLGMGIAAASRPRYYGGYGYPYGGYGYGYGGGYGGWGW